MDIRNAMTSELFALETKLAKTKTEYENTIFPEGDLVVNKNGNYYKYFNIADGERKLIPSSNKELIHKLALKKYYERQIYAYQREISAIKKFFKIGLMGGKTKKYPRIQEKSWVLIIKIRVSAQKPKKIVGIIFKNISYSPKSGKSLGYYFQKQPSQPNQSQSNILKCIRAQSITVQYTEVH